MSPPMPQASDGNSVPLTSRGRALVSLIHTEEHRLVATKKLPDKGQLHVAQEGFLSMNFMHPARFPLITQFQEIMKGEGGAGG
jgi:hypothetical protein